MAAEAFICDTTFLIDFQSARPAWKQGRVTCERKYDTWRSRSPYWP